MEPFCSDAAAVFNSTYWQSDGCTSGSCSVTWLVSQCHPAHKHIHTHMHLRAHTHTLGSWAWQTPASPSLITGFSRGAEWRSSLEKLGICLRSHFCNSSAVSREQRLALLMPGPPSSFHFSHTPFLPFLPLSFFPPPLLLLFVLP